jgi:MYXO-CTERM domain-containing protein
MSSSVSASVAATRSSWGFEVSVVSNGRRTGGGSIGGTLTNFAGSVVGQPLVDQVFGFEADIIFGTPFLLAMQLNTAASAIVRPAGAPGTPDYMLPVTASAASSFANTVLWNGLQSVTLLDGRAVEGWSVSSASGLDYSRSLVPTVPEASTWTMFALGLGVLGAAARRRRLH